VKESAGVLFIQLVADFQSWNCLPLRTINLPLQQRPIFGGILSATEGIGDGLLQDAIRRTMLIAEQAGIRALLTNPIDDEAARFYTRFGFIASVLREKQLLLLLKDARRWVR
jgi:hypothetical protein